jgi:hypothetical protein
VRFLMRRVAKLERPTGVRSNSELPTRPFNPEGFLRQVSARSKALGEPVDTTLTRMLKKLIDSDVTDLLAHHVERTLGISKPNFFVCDCLWEVIRGSKPLTLERWREAQQLYRERYGHEPAPSLEPRLVLAD